MTTKDIIKKLQKDKSHNPFHKDYTYSSVEQTAMELWSEEDDSDLVKDRTIFTCLYTGLFSPIFNETYSELKKQIEVSRLSTFQIVCFLIVSINRNYLLIQEQYNLSLKKAKEIDYLSGYRFKVDSLEPSIGEIQASSALEGEIDTMNMLINYLRYFEGENFKAKKDAISELDSIICIQKMSMIGACYNLVKTCYEDAIWNRGFIFMSDTRNLVIDYHSHNEQKLLKVGQIRFHRNSVGTYLNLIELNKNHDFVSPFEEFKKKKRIKAILIEKGLIKYKLAKGVDKKEASEELKLLSQLNTYYPFMGNEKFPKFNDLSLVKVLSMFSTIQYFFKKVGRISIPDNGISKLNDFQKFPYRVKITTVKEFLFSKLNFSKSQIKDFLSLIEVEFNPTSRVNLWDKPLIRYKDEYLFTLMGINDPIVSHLIDIWLQQGGFSLDKRGNLLENYLKNQLERIITEKGFYVEIPDASMFKIPNKGKEEIDLFLNLDSIVIIAEVKCIKYPIEVRDYHNSLKRLNEASKQVIRKTNFVRENLDFFEKKIKGIKNKEIQSLIITNFPNFSGIIIDDVPITDIFLLEAYIIAGKLYNSKIQFKKKGESIQKQYRKDSFYNNEEEFCKNFRSCMINPPAIERIKSEIEIKMNLKIKELFNFDLYVHEPIIKEGILK